MKRLTATILIIISFCAFVHAQVEKGRYFVGGNADISTTFQGKNSRFNLSLSPSFGAFVVKGFAIGGRYSFEVGSVRAYNTTRQEYVTTTTFTSGVGPSVRYYFGKKQLKGLAAANVNYLTTVTLRRNDISGTSGYRATGFLGMAHFFNPHLSLECGLYITGTGYLKQLPVTRIGFSVGLFAFLDKKKKE